MNIYPSRILTLVAVGGALSIAGCGGGGENPPSASQPEVPIEYTYPAYRAISPTGDELFIQIQKSGTSISGHFTFFFNYEGQTEIVGGPVQGDVGTDGTVQLDLYNPYDLEEPAIQSVGVQTAEGWELHDVNNPEDVAVFTPYEIPTTRSLLGNKAVIHINQVDQDIKYGNKAAPVWLLPITYLGSQISDKTTSIVHANDNQTFSMLHSWGNDWSWINLYKDGHQTATIYVKCKPHEIDSKSRPISESSYYLDDKGQMKYATGTIGPDTN